MVTARKTKLWLGALTLILANVVQAEEAVTNLAIVKSTYQGSNATENSQNLARHLAGDARWTEAAGFPYAGTYVGFEAIVANVFKPLASQWQGYKFTVEDYVASGDKVMAYGTYSGVYKLTRKYFEARVAHLWQLESGKIVSFEQFVDSKIVTDSMDLKGDSQ